MEDVDIDSIVLSNNEFDNKIGYVSDRQLRTILEILKRKIDRYNDNLRRIDELSLTESRRHSRGAESMRSRIEYENKQLRDEIDIIKRQYRSQLDNIIYGSRARRFKVIERMSEMLMTSQLLLKSISNIPMKNMPLLMEDMEDISQSIRHWADILTREYWKMGIFNRDFDMYSLDMIPIKIKNMTIVEEIIDRLRDQLDELDEYWSTEVQENATPTIDPDQVMIYL